jgi:hypothetical protein
MNRCPLIPLACAAMSKTLCITLGCEQSHLATSLLVMSKGSDVLWQRGGILRAHSNVFSAELLLSLILFLSIVFSSLLWSWSGFRLARAGACGCGYARKSVRAFRTDVPSAHPSGQACDSPYVYRVSHARVRAVNTAESHGVVRFLTSTEPHALEIFITSLFLFIFLALLNDDRVSSVCRFLNGKW